MQHKMGMGWCASNKQQIKKMESLRYCMKCTLSENSQLSIIVLRTLSCLLFTISLFCLVIYLHASGDNISDFLCPGLTSLFRIPPRVMHGMQTISCLYIKEEVHDHQISEHPQPVSCSCKRKQVL